MKGRIEELGRYNKNFEGYIIKIDNIASFISPKLKDFLWRRGEKYRDIDPRIPYNYKRYGNELNEIYWKILSEKKYSSVNQK